MSRKLIRATFEHALSKLEIKKGVEIANLMEESDKKDSLWRLYCRGIIVRFDEETVGLGESLGIVFNVEKLYRLLGRYLKKESFDWALEVVKKLPEEKKIEAIKTVLDKILFCLKDKPKAVWIIDNFVKAVNLLPEPDRTMILEESLGQLTKEIPLQEIKKIFSFLKRKMYPYEIVRTLNNHLSQEEWVDEWAITLAKELPTSSSKNSSKKIYLKYILSKSLSRGQFDIAKKAKASFEGGYKKLNQNELKKILGFRLKRGWINEETIAIANILPHPHKVKTLFRLLGKSLEKDDVDCALMVTEKLHSNNKRLALEEIILWCLKSDRWLSKAKTVAEGLPNNEPCKKILLEMLW